MQFRSDLDKSNGAHGVVIRVCFFGFINFQRNLGFGSELADRVVD